MPRHRITYNPSTYNCVQRRGWAQAGYDPLQDHLPDTLGFEHIVLNGLLEDRLETQAECVGLEARNAWYFDAFEAIADQHGVSAFEATQYFYHPDHLGSSSFITNASGDVDQHLQYLPFGEPWIDQRTQNNIRFTFSGKERDEETGYNYFGARYYNADISIWLSVDPMASERAWLTPYNYCSNNPIVRTDPSGMLDHEYKLDRKTGDITLIKRTDDKFDVLYSTNEDGILDKSNSIKINDQTILSSLENSSGNRESHVESNSANDMFKTFKFNADNSDVEWGLAKGLIAGKRTYMIGTYRDENRNPSMSNYGMEVQASVHSHPLAYESREIESIGYFRFGEGKALISGDFRNVRAGQRQNLYVYFPESGNLRNVTGKTTNPAPFIRNIGGDYRRFYFGVLNWK